MSIHTLLIRTLVQPRRHTVRRLNVTPSATTSRYLFRPAIEFLEKRDCPSSLTYSTYLGGSSDDTGLTSAVDGAGNCYVAGSTASANFPVTAGAYDTTFKGPFDGFVAKFNPAGSLLWATYL